MSNILAIETSGSVCGVGIWKNKRKPIISEDFGKQKQSEKLFEFIIDSVKKSNITINDIDTIAVSSGPGSYTGLRIGMSFAKGLAYGKNVELYAINTIDSIIYGLGLKNNFTLLVYSHSNIVYEKNKYNGIESNISQKEIKRNYDGMVICINFPENKKNLKKAKYINPSAYYIGNYIINN